MTSCYIESKYPGYVVMAGPFTIDERYLAVKRQKAAVVRAYRRLLAADPTAKLVLEGRKAFVLRGAPLIKADKNADVVSLVPIKNGQGGV